MSQLHSSSAASPFSIERKSRFTRTKTVATVGPASGSLSVLKELLAAGVDVFRINMAHGHREDHQRAVDTIREACREARRPAGILVDLAGPKIRLGQLHTDPLELSPGDEVIFVSGNSPAASHELTCSYESLMEEVSVGDDIMLSDGLIRLKVLDKGHQRVRCQVVDGGTLRSRQGVNLPGVRMGVAALLPQDIDNATWAADNQIEFVSLSFVRRASEVEDLKDRLRQRGSAAMIIAKIEKREALDHLDAIVAAADAVMVARGDLGVEIEIEKTPLAQKRIIRACARLGKPVIVATQMLESMHVNRHPTRAEVSDVANAILDGADACMLSGETAIGDWPVEAVRMMRKIQAETETALEGRPSRDFARERPVALGVTEAIIFGAAVVARKSAARMVVIATDSADAAIVKSKQRDFIPTIAVTDQPQVVNRMCLLWGISPLFAPTLDINELRDRLRRWLVEAGELESGDRVVFVADTELWPGIHDSIIVWKVP